MTVSLHIIDELDDYQQEQADQRQEFNSWLRNRKRSVDVLSLFPQHLGEQLNLRAQSFPVDPAMLVPPLLAICSSIYGKRGKVRVKGTWKEPLIIWVGTVAQPSALKSPVAAAMLAPLKRMYAEVLERYREQHNAYKAAAETYEADAKALKEHISGIRRRKIDAEAQQQLSAAKAALKELAQPEPPPPPREYFVKSVTWAKLGEICQAPTTKGLVNYRDELESWFYELDRDPQLRADWLELWPGECIKLDRKVADSAFAEETAVSIFGNTTPDNIRARMGAEYQDEQQAGDGMWCRILWCFPSHVTPVWTDDDHCIGGLLSSIYRGIDNLPDGDITVGADARQMLTAASTEYAKDATGSEPARAAFIGKLRGYLWRFAGLLNIIDRGVDPSTPAEVTGEQAIRAVDLATWFLQQFDQLMPLVGRSQLPEWAGAVVDLAQEHGGEASLRDIRRKLRCSARDALGKVLMLVEEYDCGRIDERGRGKQVWIAPDHLAQQGE